MNKIINNLGLLVGVVGLLICITAGVARVLGHYYISGFEALTLLNAGVAMMVSACMVKLYNSN